MVQFPKSEADIVKLAQAVISGLQLHSERFPNPPYTPEALAALVRVFLDQQHAATNAAALAKQATIRKEASLDELINPLKGVLRYAENAVKGDNAALEMLGWGGKAPKTPMEPPAQPRLLEAPRRGEGWIVLTWKEGMGGGKILAYKAQRRERPAGAWQDVGMSVTHEATLIDQPRMKDLEYRVIAVNKVGESEPSNLVDAVL
jgi:hypothetical protein